MCFDLEATFGALTVDLFLYITNVLYATSVNTPSGPLSPLK